ncbi:MAG: right-handed parallel beta-helix repeat-containing protein [Phycisphaerales bacterium]
MSWSKANFMRQLSLVLIVISTLLLHQAAFAQTVILRVDGDIVSAGGDGSGWGDDAFKFLQDALAEANDLLDLGEATAVHLWVAATIPTNPYVPDRDAANPDGTGDRNATFHLNFNDLTLLGGFLGDETDPDDRDPALNETVLSGAITDIPECGDPFAGGCFLANGTEACDNTCGGLECPECCEVVCAAMPDCCNDSWDQACADLAIAICGVCGDPGSGDCEDPLNGTPACDNMCNGQPCPGCCEYICEVVDPGCCSFLWDEFCALAAVRMCPPPLPAGDHPNAYHVVTAEDVDASVRIDGFTVTEGLAVGGGSDGLVGAGMLISDASLAVVRIIFTDNSAPHHGGGGMDIRDDSDPLVVNTSFIGNFGREAGALHTEDGTAGGTFVNCLFSGNTSIIEGGAINPGGGETLKFINCTFADNSVENNDGGGAIFTEAGAGAVILINCILWGNTANNQPNQINETEAEVVSVTYSDVQGVLDPGWDHGFNINDDPLFIDPDGPDNDPDTFDDNNYRLDTDSPCTDKGNNDDVPCDQFDLDNDGITCDEVDPENNEATPDLDLGDRVVDGNEIPGADVDMGAYEFVTCPWDIAPVGGDCVVGAFDLLDLLFNWGPCPGCAADFDGDDIVGASDLLAMLFNWGPCYCAEAGTVVPTIDEEMAAHCLTPADWDAFVDVMTNPLSSQEDKDNYLCWMIHYLDECSKCFCTGQANCPGADPFNG